MMVQVMMSSMSREEVMRRMMRRMLKKIKMVAWGGLGLKFNFGNVNMTAPLNL